MSELEIPFSVRPASPVDIASLAEMIRSLAAYHGDEARTEAGKLARDLFGPEPWARALIAERSGTPLGYALLCRRYVAQTAERGIDIHHLYVRNEVRGRGIGRRLVESALTEAGRIGCAFVTVAAEPENSKAQDFYRSLGWRPADPASHRFQMRLR